MESSRNGHVYPGPTNGVQSQICVKVTDPVRVTVIKRAQALNTPSKPCWFIVQRLWQQSCYWFMDVLLNVKQTVRGYSQ